MESVVDAAVATKKPFSSERFWRLAVIHYGLMIGAIAPLFFLERRMWMIVAVLYGAAMVYFEHRTRPKVEEPSSMSMPPKERAELVSARRSRRFDDVIKTAFFPLMLFALAVPNDEAQAHLWGIAGLILALYVALSTWVLVEKARQ